MLDGYGVSSHRRSHAFTAIELLVVVGVVTLLMGILLPSLHRARCSVRATVCAAQLRQLMAAVHLYSDQSREWLPSAEPATHPEAGDPTESGNWFANPFLLRQAGCTVQRQPDGTPAGPPKKDSVFICPDHPSCCETRPETDKPSVELDYGLSYGMNVALGAGGRPRNENLEQRRQSEFKRPYLTMILADAWGTSTARGIVAAFSCPKDSFSFRHSGKTNFAFLDGHVSPLDEERVPFGVDRRFEDFWSTKRISTLSP